MKRIGFTLIELLVVIAIIAILAAILFPVFAKAREKARQTSCLSNLKQLVLGVLQYAQDYDEVFPGPGYWQTYAGDDNGPLGRPWMPKILPYVKNVQVYICPSLKAVNTAYTPIPTSYCWPEFMSGHFAGGLIMPIRGQGAPSLGQIEEPSRMFVMSDGPAYDSDYGIIDYAPYMKHNDGGNIAYADGHAKWLAFMAWTGGPATGPVLQSTVPNATVWPLYGR
jgi:prepilin-type N-terminal cleavage/methylation domain-containing protein/prepilin-type processing-associated H-X9-DG protein